MRPEDLAYAAFKENPCDETQDSLYKAVLLQVKNIIFLTLHRERMDLAGNAATRAILNLDTFKENCAFSTWTYRIAKTEAFMEIRRINRRNEDALVEEEVDSYKVDTGLDGYAVVLLEDIFKGLELVDQKILEAKMFGSSEEEIAEAVDLTTMGVHMRWRRLKKHVMSLLKRF